MPSSWAASRRSVDQKRGVLSLLAGPSERATACAIAVRASIRILAAGSTRNGMAPDVGAALRGKDTQRRGVDLKSRDGLAQILPGFDILYGDHVTVLVMAAVQIHRCRLDALCSQLGVADQPEGAPALLPIGLASAIDGKDRFLGNVISS